jgi:hypothetical protein
MDGSGDQAIAHKAKRPTGGSVLKVQQKVGSWKGGFGDQT